jgi:hypothetical protein
MKDAVEQPPKGAWFRRTDLGFSIGCYRLRIVECFIAAPALVLGGFFTWAAIKIFLQKNGSWDQAVSIFFGAVAWCYLWLVVAYQRISVTVKNTRGRVFTGIWPLGFYQRFDWDKVSSISLRRTSFSSHGSVRTGLSVAIKESQRERYLLFAFQAELDRQKYIVRQLQKMRTEYVSCRARTRPDRESKR